MVVVVCCSFTIANLPIAMDALTSMITLELESVVVAVVAVVAVVVAMVVGGGICDRPVRRIRRRGLARRGRRDEGRGRDQEPKPSIQHS